MPSTPASGNIITSDDRMSVEYICNEGFTLKGNTTRYCDETGSGWDGSDPICGRCTLRSNNEIWIAAYKSVAFHANINRSTCSAGRQPSLIFRHPG